MIFITLPSFAAAVADAAYAIVIRCCLLYTPGAHSQLLPYAAPLSFRLRAICLLDIAYTLLPLRLRSLCWRSHAATTHTADATGRCAAY